MSYTPNQILWVKIRDKKRMIQKIYPRIDDSCGIYIIFRFDFEENKPVGYIGQAKKILTRLAQHMLGYQWIDISLKKHKLYDKEKNPAGYKFGVLAHCSPSELDLLEKEYISQYLNDGWILRNVSGGGQKEKAENVNSGKAGKKYNDGLKQGYENCLKEVREFFEKYLTYKIKGSSEVFKKNGDVKEIYKTKYQEFKKLLEGDVKDDKNEIDR